SPVTARIDNTPPGRVGVSVDGGDSWRNENNFSLSWTNPPESDRGPIVAADYKQCTEGGGGRSQGDKAGGGIARLPVHAPGADAALPPGNYVLRATAHDQAQNESSTTQRSDGQPMTMTLPLRIPSMLQAGIVRTHLVKQRVRRHGKRRTVRRRVTELESRGII